MNKHKWHKEIKAWADGAEIEYACANSLEYNWHPLDNVSRFEHRNTNFRIKPQPKEPQYLYVYNGKGKTVLNTLQFPEIITQINGDHEALPYIGKIKLEKDDE